MNRYTLRKEPEYDTPWIALPNNGGDVGDMADITNELNRLLGDLEVAKDECETHAKSHLDAWQEIQDLRIAVIPVIEALAGLADTDDWRGVAKALVRCHTLLDKFPDLAPQNH